MTLWTWLVQGVSQKLSMSSRVALVGANGAGKTTLLKLLVGDLEMGDGGPTNKGELFKHHNLRVRAPNPEPHNLKVRAPT